MNQPTGPWYGVSNIQEIDSPALLLYRSRLEENIRRMIALAGGTERLRPHVKTHKMAEITRLQMDSGITQFKCATIAEAEMLAQCGAQDVLLAYQPVGPKIARFIALMRHFPGTTFSTIIDDEKVARELSAAWSCSAGSRPVRVFLDIDCGMHRSGIGATSEALDLCQILSTLPALEVAGLHAYDGHIHQSDVLQRTAECDEAFGPVLKLRDKLVRSRLAPPLIVAGGSPTFPIHATREHVQCSPGTCLLWDAGYQKHFPDLGFLTAALVLTRVVSKPARDKLCLDLGHKAIAAENPHPRVEFFDLPEARAVMHSEEHLVLQTDQAQGFQLGDCLYGVPWHICPTVALYGQAWIIENNRAVSEWKILARERKISI